MDTQSLMQLREADEELERDFIEFCQRTLIGLPEDVGMKLAKQLLADYNAFKIDRPMKVRKMFRHVH